MSGSSFNRRRVRLFLLSQCVILLVLYSLIWNFAVDITQWLPRSLRASWEINTDMFMGRRIVFPFLRYSPRYSIRPINSFKKLKNELTVALHQKNQEPPRNRDIFPRLAPDHIPIVLYVHNRPKYLELVVESLAKVQDIHETVLIVSHDGYYPEMNAIVEKIDFCQVKQIFALFSPHIFKNSFPGRSADDCDYPPVGNCTGELDQYGKYRQPEIVSLKHHWWWMMNTVWDGLVETRNHEGNILFIEEDHFIFPNAYRTIKMLRNVRMKRCPECVAINLAPQNVQFRGEGIEVLVVEKIGNVGYSFNRTVFRLIQQYAEQFCTFDDYNWDITLWAVVYPFFPLEGRTLRGPRTSAVHVGKCGLHEGKDNENCRAEKVHVPPSFLADVDPFLGENWRILRLLPQGYSKGFQGWGGWADKRDQNLCLAVATMYNTTV